MRNRNRYQHQPVATTKVVFQKTSCVEFDARGKEVSWRCLWEDQAKVAKEGETVLARTSDGTMQKEIEVPASIFPKSLSTYKGGLCDSWDWNERKALVAFLLEATKNFALKPEWKVPAGDGGNGLVLGGTGFGAEDD